MSNEKQLPPFNRSLEEWTKLESVRKFILDSIALCKPDRVYICNGSLQEYDEVFVELEVPTKYHSYAHHLWKPESSAL